MSGIVGSRLNIRGSGLVGSLGTDGQVLTSSGAGVGAVYEAAAGGSAGIDDQSSSNDDQLTITDSAVVINEDSDDLDFRVESNGLTHAFFIDGGNDEIGIGESAPDTTQGVSINQAAEDGFIMSFKSSDIAHGVTTDAETDTFGIIRSASGGPTGGIKIRGFSEGEIGVGITATYTTDNTNHSSGASAPLSFDARKKSGTDDGAAGADANLLRVTNAGSPKFIIDEDGDIFYDGAAAAFDSYDDAQLVRAMDMVKSPEGFIASKFDKFLKYNKKDLKKSGVLDNISEEEEAEGQVPFVCITKLQKLHNGAIWQQYEKHQQLLEAVYDLAKEAVGEEKADAILEKHEVKRLQ